MLTSRSPRPLQDRTLKVFNDQLLWCWRKGCPAHGFPCGRLEGSDGGGGEASSSSLSAAAPPPDVTSVLLQTCHVLLTQWREEFMVVCIERVSEAPKNADDADPLSAPAR